MKAELLLNPLSITEERARLIFERASLCCVKELDYAEVASSVSPFDAHCVPREGDWRFCLKRLASEEPEIDPLNRSRERWQRGPG